MRICQEGIMVVGESSTVWKFTQIQSLKDGILKATTHQVHVTISKYFQYTFHVQRNTFRQYRNRRIIRGSNTWKVFHHIYRKPIMWLKQAQLHQLKDSLSNNRWGKDKLEQMSEGLQQLDYNGNLLIMPSFVT